MSYKVESGDTFWAISQKLHVSVDALMAANPGIAANSLTVGSQLKVPSGNSSSGNAGASGGSSGSGYVPYSGPASNFPDPKNWASWDKLWADNERLMKFHDSDSEIAAIKQSIQQVSKESGVDARAILCIVVQESGGNVRVHTTNNGVRNPGLMQSHNGAEFSASDPAGSILQMIRDGTVGTRDGPGLKQLYAKYGDYYSAFRAYNSGSINARDLNDPVGATPTYVQSAANRLMGHVWANM